MDGEPLVLEPELIADAIESEYPNYQTNVVSAKNYLKKQNLGNGDNTYDHIVNIVQRLLTRGHPDAPNNFEQISHEVRYFKLRAEEDLIEDIKPAPPKLPLANTLYELMEKVTTNIKTSSEEKLDAEVEELELEEEIVKTKEQDIFEDNYYFKQIGHGMSDSECFNVAMALKLLASTQPIVNVRFFGKIYGTKANYYVAESNWNEEEAERRLREFEFGEVPGEGQEEQENEQAKDEVVAEEEAEEIKGEGASEIAVDAGKEVEPPKLPSLPVSNWQPPSLIPAERPTEGLNKKVYWVCHTPGKEWTLLPDIQPTYISIAKRITRVMTGDLEAEIQSYPPFDGREKDYLRAQIARIAASTLISPAGFMTMSSGAEEEDVDPEEDMDGEEMRVNPYYEGHTMKELTNVNNWVHHSPYILNNGRLTRVPKDIDEAMGEEEEDEVLSQNDDEAEEAVPPLMTSIAEDRELEEEIPPWFARPYPMRGIVAMRSVLWHGAVAYATPSKKSGCLYMGWTIKKRPLGYAPVPFLPPTQTEYPLGPEIMEMSDPSVGDEEAWRVAHLPPALPPKYGEGEGGVDEMDEESEFDDEEEEE